MTLFIIKEVTVLFGNQIQTLLLLLDLDHFIFIIDLFFWRLNPVCIDFTVAVSSYTSLGHSIKSNSYASVHKLVKFQ